MTKLGTPATTPPRAATARSRLPAPATGTLPPACGERPAALRRAPTTLLPSAHRAAARATVSMASSRLRSRLMDSSRRTTMSARGGWGERGAGRAGPCGSRHAAAQRSAPAACGAGRHAARGPPHHQPCLGLRAGRRTVLWRVRGGGVVLVDAAQHRLHVALLAHAQVGLVLRQWERAAGGWRRGGGSGNPRGTERPPSWQSRQQPLSLPAPPAVDKTARAAAGAGWRSRTAGSSQRQRTLGVVRSSRYITPSARKSSMASRVSRVMASWVVVSVCTSSNSAKHSPREGAAAAVRGGHRHGGSARAVGPRERAAAAVAAAPVCTLAALTLLRHRHQLVQIHLLALQAHPRRQLPASKQESQL